MLNDQLWADGPPTIRGRLLFVGCESDWRCSLWTTDGIPSHTRSLGIGWLGILFDYIQTSYDAHLSLSQLPGEVCFSGHSHIPVAFIQKRFVTYTFNTELTIEPGMKALVNVGSVGQPRDNNPHACFAIYDTEKRKVSIRRVAYDVDAAAARIREAGLPEVLGERLKIGRWSQEAPLYFLRVFARSFFDTFMTRIFSISSVSVFETR